MEYGQCMSMLQAVTYIKTISPGQVKKLDTHTHTQT